MDATESLLLEVGADRMSIRAVSARCGYQAPTIYHHFGDKGGLVDACLEERFCELFEQLERVPRRADTALYVRDLAGALVSFGLRNPTHYRMLSAPRQETSAVPPSAEKVRALVASSLDELAGEGRLAVPDGESAFQVTWAMLHGLILLQISRPDYEWHENLTESALDVLLRGLYLKEASGR